MTRTRSAHGSALLHEADQDVGRDRAQPAGRTISGLTSSSTRRSACASAKRATASAAATAASTSPGGRPRKPVSSGRAQAEQGRRAPPPSVVGSSSSARSSSSSTSTPPGADHEAQAELRVAADADDQLGHAVRDHRLDQERLAQARHAAAAADRGGIAQVQPHRARSLLCASAARPP